MRQKEGQRFLFLPVRGAGERQSAREVERESKRERKRERERGRNRERERERESQRQKERETKRGLQKRRQRHQRGVSSTARKVVRGEGASGRERGRSPGEGA